jgi:RNA polymerase sigma-70 factor (ECF subfamily)
LRACTEPFDEGQHNGTAPALDPEALLLRTDGVTLITRTMSDLPERSRELLVGRELEGLSYQELADAMGIPMGTVMSRLSRARRALRGALRRQLTPPHRRDLVGPKTRRARTDVAKNAFAE